MAMGDNQRGWTIALVAHAKMRTVALDNPDTPDYRSHLTVSPEDPPDPWFLSDMGTERLTSYMTPIDPSALLLRPKQSRDVLAPTQATSAYDRDVDTGVRTPQKAPVLRPKPSNSSFKELQSRYEPALASTAQTEISEDSTQGEPRSRRPRPSLSERAQETLAQIPPSPVVNRRKSSFFNPESPMRPPSRSTNGSRPGSSYENDGKMRPPSRQAASRPGSSAGFSSQAVPIDFRASTNTFKSNLNTPVKRQSIQTLKTPKSVSSLRLAASSKAPGAPNPTTPYKSPAPALGVKSGSQTVGRAVRPRASVTGLFDEQPFEASRPAESKPLRTVRPRASIGSFSKPTISELPNIGSPRTSVGLKKVSPTFSNASSTSASTTSQASKESITTIGSPQSKETTPKKSSIALREQIAKAKAAKRAVMAKTAPVVQSEAFAEEAPVIPSGTFDFGLEDPFNQNAQDPSKGLLRKRIDGARTDGRLNIAAMGLKEIPDEVMNMYNLENMNGQASSWAECVDLTRFVAADNELETIGDDIFPDIDARDSADDDDARGNQFGGLETLDLHGNTLISIPRGLRRLEMLTTLNLSNNKLQNECFEIISQIPSLRDLKIANNSLCSELSSGLLSLVNLEVLDLHNNQLSSLPAGLGDLTRLRVLNLSQNTFTSLPFNAFQRLPLTELTAANNKLCGTLIQSNAAEFPKLRTLDISGNSIKSLSSGSLSLPLLQLLTVSANRLTHLPNVSTWLSLLTLSASDNSISALPEGFVSLPILKTADLQGNDLRILDDNIALMDSLDTLLVSGNPLREKKFSGMNTADLKKVLKGRLEPDEPEPEPETIVEIQNNGFGATIAKDDDSDTGTEYLDAPSTPTLPRSPSASEWSINTTLGILDRSYSQSYSLNPLVAAQIASENKIKTMELHHNNFTEIPTSIAFFSITLTTLNMSHNSLTSDTFMKDEIELPALKELNLSSNTFSSLSPILRLLSAPRLEKLDVSFNRLTTLPFLRGAFPLLTAVLASNNTIREVSAQNVTGLRVLDVGSNELERLDARLGLVESLHRTLGRGYPEALGYLGRVQWVLQTGTPKVDLIFWDKQSAQNAYPQPLYWFADLMKAGYTHEYLSPANFLLEQAIVRDGVFAPNAQAAKAIIIRGNDKLTPEGVQYHATYAAAGLPTVISGGLPSKYGSGNQAAVSKAKAILRGLLSLKNVHQVPLEGLAARIKSMGITPRVQVQSNGSWYPRWREDSSGDIYVWIYNDGADSAGSLTFATSGTPYFLNAWTGEEELIFEYTEARGSTTLLFTLKRHETYLVKFTKKTRLLRHAIPSSDSDSVLGFNVQLLGSLIQAKVAYSSPLSSVSTSFGIPHTFRTIGVQPAYTINSWSLTSMLKKKNLTVPIKGPFLKSWKDLGFPDVSGIGFYRTSFDWSPSLLYSTEGAYLILPPVSDGVVGALNGKHLPKGENVLEFKVSSTLKNSLKPIWDNLRTAGGGVASSWNATASLGLGLQHYGLIGEVRITNTVGLQHSFCPSDVMSKFMPDRAIQIPDGLGHDYRSLATITLLLVYHRIITANKHIYMRKPSQQQNFQPPHNCVDSCRAIMATRKILITGATGKQGGAVIDALLSSGSSFQILALTRNASSRSAQSLASKPNVTVVEGDSSSPASVFKAHSPIHAVFSVTIPGKAGFEEGQAKPLIDESVKNGVDHFVFTSVDRGGPGRSEKNPTNIEHFASKHRIEEYLKEKSENGSKMAFTILRPVCFMDNLTPDFIGRSFASMWRGVGNKPLQLVSVHDIGIFAAKAFVNPEYKGKAISLAGDELTIEEGRKVFKETMGYDMPESFGFVGTGLKLMMKELGTMFKWFETDGYGADIQALRKEEPALQNFSIWLKESSKFPKQ
ncbi:hypothetical protein V496_05816 [Pseudogymnoascus sp. VKM F-4515 (FW-2607)]|nr:hypothetical protein V496_05816 [Pseudogymnoascus sp. VKM F-4515 (FW-2607)]